MHPSDGPSSPSAWHIASAVAGWFVPGLGHLLIGEKQRGVILLVAIGSLWLAGTLMGGVTVFDWQQHRLWFLGQMLIAPSCVVLYVHDNLHNRIGGEPKPTDTPPLYTPAFGRTHEQGLLYTSLAGLLNLLAIVDVLYRDPRKIRPRDLLEQDTGDGDLTAA